MEKINSKYAISAGHAITLKAAKDVLESGGNAADAAIAAYWMMFVSEPVMASIGAGGFAMTRFQNKVQVLDFFCQTPLRKRPVSELDFYPITVDFGNETEDFHVGKGSAATPGAIAGIFDLHKVYGSIPMSDLVQPAIEAAKEGVQLDRFQAYDLKLLAQIIGIHHQGRATFFNENEAKKEGDLIKMPDFADMAYVIAREGRDLVYKGEIASQIAADSVDNGSLSYTDFQNYQTLWLNPLQFSFEDYRVMTTPAPSMGGVLIADILKRLEGSRFSHYSKEHFQEWADTMEATFKHKKDLPKLKEYLTTNYGIQFQQTEQGGLKEGGTSHFNIVDKWGNAVALTTSLGEGNGYFIPGTQMQMNNMLGEAAILPHGFHSWECNKRLSSMMTPTMVLDKEAHLRMVTGSGGAGRIPFAIAQSILYHLHFNLPLEEAVHASKLYFDGHKTQVESGFDIGSSSNNIKVWKEASLYFGGTHSISIEKGSADAVADQRRFGSAKTG